MKRLAEILFSAPPLPGGGVVLAGNRGTVRPCSTMERLRAPANATMPGLGGLLSASVLFFPAPPGVWTARERVALFPFIIAPMSAKLIAGVHLRRVRSGEGRGIAGPPPRPTDGVDRATFGALRDGLPVPAAGG